jgi:hypothetical protein
MEETPQPGRGGKAKTREGTPISAPEPEEMSEFLVALIALADLKLCPIQV